MQSVDTIVVGLGAMGAATLLQLARRGQRVLGIDRFHPPHAWGSTHGDTRITRLAIGEGEQYGPLVRRSHAIWREIERETGEELLNQCGALILSPAASTAIIHGKENFVRRTIGAAERGGVTHEVLDAAETMRRFPQFHLRGDELVYYEAEGGYVRPERCVAAQLTLAERAGAAVRYDAPVLRLGRDGSGVRVETADEVFHAAEIVLAAGVWSPGLVGGVLAPPMRVLRQVLHWWEPREPALFEPGRCPVYIWMHGDTAEESFYGFPTPPGTTGVKVAMEQYLETTHDPDALRREVSAEEADAMHREHLAERMPGLLPRPLRSAVCPYTMTPDGDFLVARAPENDRVLLVSACSGHGFKHSAGLGEAVAQMLTGSGQEVLAGFGAERLMGVAA